MVAAQEETRNRSIAMFRQLDTNHDNLIDPDELLLGLMGEPYFMEMVSKMDSEIINQSMPCCQLDLIMLLPTARSVPAFSCHGHQC